MEPTRHMIRAAEYYQKLQKAQIELISLAAKIESLMAENAELRAEAQDWKRAFYLKQAVDTKSDEGG